MVRSCDVRCSSKTTIIYFVESRQSSLDTFYRLETEKLSDCFDVLHCVAEMAKGKKKKGPAKHETDSQEQGSNAIEGHHAALHHTHINRTRSKLPTKRKQLRQGANTSVPPPGEYEAMAHLPRPQANRHASRGGFWGGRGGGRGGLGHANRNNGRRITIFDLD
jgi:hypothetical protein